MPILPPPPVALYGDLARARQIASSWKLLGGLADADADNVARAIAQGIAEGRRHGLTLAKASFETTPSEKTRFEKASRQA